MTGRPRYHPVRPGSKWSLVGAVPPRAVRVEFPITSKGYATSPVAASH